MTLTANPPIDLPLETLNADQKWRLFDWLKSNLTLDIEPQDGHFDVIAERERMLASGETKVISLNQFAQELREELP
jgi:hypothetical protein